jgi:hypothetical protein
MFPEQFFPSRKKVSISYSVSFITQLHHRSAYNLDRFVVQCLSFLSNHVTEKMDTWRAYRNQVEMIYLKFSTIFRYLKLYCSGKNCSWEEFSGKNCLGKNSPGRTDNIRNWQYRLVIRILKTNKSTASNGRQNGAGYLMGHSLQCRDKVNTTKR